MEPFKTDKITQESIDKSKLYFPENEVQAEWMQKAGYRWIADNAPHKLTDLAQELAAANKAIVALSEIIDDFVDKVDHGYARSVDSYGKMKAALEEHAPAIEKARGG